MLMIKCIDAADVLLAHTTMKFQPKTELLTGSAAIQAKSIAAKSACARQALCNQNNELMHLEAKVQTM